MSFLGRFLPSARTCVSQAPHSARAAVERAMPAGPLRKASTRGFATGQLTDLGKTIKDTLIFDCADHWFYLFIGCAEIGNSFELSVRTRKLREKSSPPAWPVEAAALVANDIAEGARCVTGTTWKLGEIVAPFDGLMALPDVAFGDLQPTTIYQLVPITEEELEIQGEEKIRLAQTIHMNGLRMIGAHVGT
jgi:hypothetical protein